MFNKPKFNKNGYQLTGKFAKKGYDWWWHSFTAINSVTKEETPFFIEFFIVNPALSPEKVVLGQAKENKGINRPSYLMVKCGCWGKNKSQLHRFIPIKDVNINKCPIRIEAFDCLCSETELKGSVNVDKVEDGMMCDTGSMSFNLKIDKKITYNVGYGTSGLFRGLKAFEMYWHASGMKSLFEGEIIYNGVKYIVSKDTCYGYSDKNWGSNFTTPWLWLSSNKTFDADTKEQLFNTVFDIGGGKPKAFGITFKDKLLGAYYIEGKEYEFNFSKFAHPSKTSFSFDVEDGVCHWRVEQSNKKAKIITTVTCLVEDMLFVNYEAPNGLKQHNKLYNGGNGKGTLEIFEKNKREKEYHLVRKINFFNTGCEFGEFDK